MLQRPYFASNFDGGWENQIFPRHGNRGINVLITFDRLQHFKMCCTTIECQKKCRMIILQTFLHL
jgi:hypothetical protein